MRVTGNDKGMAYVNVAEWNPDHVADWIRGLEDEIQPYSQFFINHKVNGCQLLTMTRDDLTQLNMNKIGHQELVLEAVELLRQLHYNLTSETLQSLALKLGCKAQSLFNDLKVVSQAYANTGKKERISVETLSSVADLLNVVKTLISWLDRYPFAGQDTYSNVRKFILKLSVELASTAQRDQFADNPHGVIREICLKLASQSDKVVQEFNDSLIIQPASLEVAKVKRKSEDDLGIHINSLYSGVHIIENIKYQSPAYRSGKVEEGDEIVQVNYQTVVGWQIKNIICAMKEHPTEVHLTLKKRPRHPNVLGQVITLWPYRIPSKKTAFRKLYKWSKGKDIRDLCPRSPGTRGESNSVSEVHEELISEKEKLFAVNKPRNKLRRRATVTGVSPTTLQAPVSLEELIGSNSKRKDTVLRTISYDPNKTIDLEDNVFNKKESQSSEPAAEDIKSDVKENCETAIVVKDEKQVKNTFLRPPQEKFNTGHLKRQEALKNSETVARAGVAAAMPTTNCSPTPKPALRLSTMPQNTVNDSGVVQDAPPSSPKQKLAEWVNRQKKKPEVGLLQHALTLFSSDSSSQPCSSPKENGSPNSPKCGNGSPKVKKSTGSMFQFPFREGRPSLSELRSLKRTANSKVFSERVNSSSQGEKPVTSPKQIPLHIRSQLPNIRPGLNTNPALPTKPSKLQPDVKPNAKITESYIHPKNINYAKIPQYPCEMHESKIVSLKARANFNQQPIKQVPQPTRNNLHYQRARQMAKLTATQGNSTLLKNKKPGYPTAFYSPSGRSLSFNNIAISSEDDSSSEEYEIYEELSTVSAPDNPTSRIQQDFQQPLTNEMDPHFTRQLAEMYNMLSQRQHLLQSQGNGPYKGQINAANSAVIDELALRMYHALQMNHLQSQSSQPPNRPPPRAAPRNFPPANGSYVIPSKLPQRSQFHQLPHPLQKLQSFTHDHTHVVSKQQNVVKEQQVEPQSCNPSTRVFKSATSQEIHNLYTSQLANKSSTSSPPENEGMAEYSEKEHTYETIPYLKDQRKSFSSDGQVEKSSFLCPAEKEFEYDVPCKDGVHFQNCNIPEKVHSSPRLLKDNVFVPIKENKNNFDAFYAFQQVNYNKNSEQQSNMYTKYIENCDGNQIEDMRKVYGKNVQPAIVTLMKNIPKPPPSETYSTKTKSSSSQTEEDFVDQSEEISSTVGGLTNDDSYTTALNCTSNSITDSLGYCSSSSLNSSSSGSIISSAGSCYYYADLQMKSQNVNKNTVENCEDAEDAPLIDLRSPTLPTMGVSMLGKKRSTSTSGSEQGSRASPCIPPIMEADFIKPSRIVTDVEHTI